MRGGRSGGGGNFDLLPGPCARMETMRLGFALWLAAVPLLNGQAAKPSFSFGVVADVQYADQASAGQRRYRDSAGKLQECAAAMRREAPRFVVQLGDLVDGGPANLDRIFPVFFGFPGRKYSVLGNHDSIAPRDALLKRLRMGAAFYTFAAPGWRFIVLDAMQASVGAWPAADPHYTEGSRLLAQAKAAGSSNAADWNGGLGNEQREWLGRVLAAAARRRERAVVFCHSPVLAESCGPEHLLWDHRETLEILDASPALSAWFNGHDHNGGYAAKSGIHYVTLEGMVEHPVSETCKIVDMYPDRLVIRAAGQPSGGRELKLRR
jgi:manganese-dependent ADP-ribose/CDP-alcohol diphosphatase